jgi:hypothetical protein
MSAHLSKRRPLDLSREIQCAVTARYPAMFAFDQMSDVKLILPAEDYQSKLVSRRDRKKNSSLLRNPA